MPGFQLLRLMMEKASASGSRSTALGDLKWLLAIIGVILLGSIHYSASSYVTVGLFVALILVIIYILLAFAYFAKVSPDALRSETFTLSKMAMEKSVTGDSLSGFQEERINDSSPVTQAIEHKADQSDGS